ncbi:ABATE domain-containing protein [Streptomyces sp. NPDC001781]
MALGTSRFDAGRDCLDLLATAHPKERIGTARDLTAWIVEARLVPAGSPLGQADGGWVADFLELRWHVERLMRASRAPADSLEGVNRAARAAAPPAVRAVAQQNGSLTKELAEMPTAAALLSLLARDAVDLLTDPLARAAVRECAAKGCSLLYLDTSRGRRRRWCSSEACGNRERVARHRRRVALARS